jgi:hypothetical protein
MPQFGLLAVIPEGLKRHALDTLVDFLSGQAKKFAGDELAAKIKKLRSDAAFNQAFEAGLKRAAQRFITEYEAEDEDPVAAIAADEGFFKNEEVQAALLTILKKPGTYLSDEQERVAQSFASVLPERRNRERVGRAITYLLKCPGEELWHLPELQPIYSLQFQRMAAEATRQQVDLQKAQLQALTSLKAEVRGEWFEESRQTNAMTKLKEKRNNACGLAYFQNKGYKSPCAVPNTAGRARGRGSASI